MPVTLKNTSKRMRQFHLPKTCPGGTIIEQHRIVTDKHGVARYRPKKVMMPAVLTMLPGEVCSDLPDQVLASPQIKKALADPKDGLRLMKQTSPKPAAAPQPKPATAPKSEAKASTKTAKKAGE